MTLHAEVIVFCNDFGWLVGGKGKRRGLARKQPSQSQLLKVAVRVLGPGTLSAQEVATLGLDLQLGLA